MGWFTRSPPPLETWPAECRWAVLQGQYEERPMFLRRNESAKAFNAHPQLPYQVGLAVPLKWPNEHGLPASAESAELSDIEDAVHQTFDPDGSAFLVAVVTTGGMREFVLYAKDSEDVRRRHADLAAQITHHEIQLLIQHDPDWNVFAQFA